MKIKIEITDLFGGEANYNWVKKEEIELPDNASDLSIIRTVKKITQYNGIRSNTTNYGDMIKLDFTPSGLLHVMFIMFE